MLLRNLQLLSFTFLILCPLTHHSIHAAESQIESSETCLTNIKQLTFSEIGFEKAGEAYFSPDSSTIIFQAVPKGEKHYQIFVMNLDENIPRMVSTGRGACTCAFFRPDGKKIIFASSHEDPSLNEPENAPGYKRDGKDYSWEFTPYMNIYEANPDGTDLKPLTSGPAYTAECAYNHDGSKIVFASNRDGSMNLYTMDADGKNIFQVTHDTHCYYGGPFFSPDGTKIIFRADKTKQHHLQIYQIDIDGTNEIQHTNNDAVNWAPYWHPNGTVIAFTTSLHGHHQYEIYLMNLLNGELYRVTVNPSFDGLSVFNNAGNKIMWTSKRTKDKTCQIFIADFTLDFLRN